MEIKNNWIALVALALAMLVVGLEASVLNVALPTVAKKLGANTRQLPCVINACTLALAGAMLPAGVLTDSIHALIALRTVMGLGAAIIMPIVMALIPIIFNDEERPQAVAAMATSVSLGVPLGPIIGGYLLKHYAWHSICWINAPVIVLAMIAVAFLIQESRAPHAPRLDIPGVLLSTVGIVMLVFGFVEAPASGWTAISTIG